MPTDLSLQSRLRNCLHTILELNESVDSPALLAVFMQELDLIRKFLQRLDEIVLEEEDVARIERATEVFLCELHGLFSPGKPTVQLGLKERLQ